MYKNVIKRYIDIVLAVIVLVLALPVMAVTALAVKLDSPGHVIFTQKRLGLNGREFDFYKFRSMVVNAEHTGSGVYSDKNDDRVTRVIRATSLDELPQIINILRGDMSFIGPRPPLTHHPWPIEKYTDAQRRMFEVRTGITGWAQIHGRKEVEWHKRIRMNVWYVDHCSFRLDTIIFLTTILKVLTGAGNENKGETLKK